MDKDQVGGKVDQAIGSLKQKAGEVFGNDRLANEGAADQVKGAGKETWGNVKDAVGVGTTSQATRTGSGTEARENFSDSVKNVKDSINEKIDDFKDRNR